MSEEESVNKCVTCNKEIPKDSLWLGFCSDECAWEKNRKPPEGSL